MRLPYLLFFLSLNAWPQNNPSIRVIPEPKNLEDFEHHFKGCPANSECDQVMGLQLTRWKDLIGKVKSPSMPSSKKAQFLELFRAKYGIPIEFYTGQKSQQGFKPLLFNSPCKAHNPKQKDAQVLKGMAFVKSIPDKTAIVWRDQTQYEISTEDLLVPQPVTVYYPEGPKSYSLPLNDQPLFIKNKDLIVLREEDDFFYILKVSENGSWKIENLDMTKLSDWEDKKQNVTCPKDSNKKTSPIFAVEFCKSVWDEDLRKNVVVKMHEGCVL